MRRQGLACSALVEVLGGRASGLGATLLLVLRRKAPRGGAPIDEALQGVAEWGNLRRGSPRALSQLDIDADGANEFGGLDRVLFW